ncbi:M20 family metallopeptidase [Streptomyces sp. DT224]|uniref:M20 family metallopeptidase n=1 Tax=Streptomyces sp. DT224 TaxID=3393426 RepID=UPI003CF28C24
MDFEGLLGVRRRAAREELAETVRTLAAQQEPHSKVIPVAPLNAFYEPRLYSQLVLGGFPSMTADQLLLAATPGEETEFSVLTDDEGVICLPGLGQCATERRSVALPVRRMPETGALELEGGDETYAIEPAGFVPGTRIELAERLDPILRTFLDMYIDEPEKLTVVSDGSTYLPQIGRALEVIAAVSPVYHQALIESLRAILLFQHPTAESFAALGMHGMIFLNVPDGAGAGYFVEELVHQGGHVLFSEATLNRGDFFRVDPESPLSEIIGQEDPRNVYDAFHGLFTEHMEYQIVLGALDDGPDLADERPSFEEHLRSVTARHQRDLRLIEPHADKVFTELGNEVFTAFQQTYERAVRSHPVLFGGPPDAEELLRELIAIPSVNPLLPGSEGVPDERDMAAFVAERLRTAGVEVRTQEISAGRCNVIARLPRAGEADDNVVLLSAHMDTYPAGGPRAAYEPVGDGRTLYGRGSADAKGSLAAMVTAFLQAAAEPNRREAYLAATVDEECLLRGVRALAEHGMRPTLGITGEPTLLAPVAAQKGIVRGTFLVSGPPCHAAYPADVTAVSCAAELVGAVGRLNAALGARPGHSSLGSPTVTVTRLDSSGGMNLSAAEVTVAFDARFLPGTTGEDFATSMESELRELLPAHVDFALQPLAFVSPPNEASSADPLVAEFYAVVRDVVGTCEPEAFAYGSEAGVLAEFCRASLVFGPGDARCSHAETEGVELGQLTAATDIFRSILLGVQP